MAAVKENVVRVLKGEIKQGLGPRAENCAKPLASRFVMILISDQEAVDL